MTARPEAATPCHFGPRGELFGMFHAPVAPAAIGVLLCPPLGQDMIRSHRVYRQLAQAVSTAGMAAMRFDYHGTGDSGGTSAQVDLSRCVDDTVTAADELRRRSGCGQVMAFGGRLGGSIAMLAVTPADFTRIVAWDPVLDGAAHVAHMDAVQERMRADLTRFPHPRSEADSASQWLGFTISQTLRQQATQLHIEPTPRTRILDSQSPLAGADRAAWTAAGADAIALQTPVAWDSVDQLERAILSPELVQTVVSCLREH